MGKLDCELPKIKVPERLYDDVYKNASSLGMSMSEYMREALMIQLYGAEYVASLYQQRTLSIAQIGAPAGEERGRS